jgi:hypothetical protein
MKYDFQKLRVQRYKWKIHNRNVICWAFYCVNDNKEVDVKFKVCKKFFKLFILVTYFLKHVNMQQ